MENHKDEVGLLMSLCEDVTNTPKQESLDDWVLSSSTVGSDWQMLCRFCKQNWRLLNSLKNYLIKPQNCGRKKTMEKWVCDSTLLCSCPSAHWYHLENKMWEKWICSGDAGKLCLQGAHSSEGLDVAHGAFFPQPSLSNCKLCQALLEI